MSLDTVMLIVDIEKTFDISLLDSETEKINTVQDLADSVTKKLVFKQKIDCLTQKLFYRLRRAFELAGEVKTEIRPNTPIYELLPKQDISIEVAWRRLEKNLGLRLPDLVHAYRLDREKKMPKEVRFLGFRIFGKTELMTQNTIKTLIGWIISLNYQKLLNVKELGGQYEVEQIVLGIISDSLGIPLDEIKLQHSIANDLGID